MLFRVVSSKGYGHKSRRRLVSCLLFQNLVASEHTLTVKRLAKLIAVFGKNSVSCQHRNIGKSVEAIFHIKQTRRNNTIMKNANAASSFNLRHVFEDLMIYLLR